MNNNNDGPPPKMEPDCVFCTDTGCPECDPSPQAQQNRITREQDQRAAFAAAVERGEAVYDDESPF